MLEMASSKEYIADKILKNKQGQNTINNNGKQKVIIGKGGFGTVKFALSLTESDKIKVGELICIKKSKEIGFKK